MDAFTLALVVGTASIAFPFGWIVGRESQRRFNRRMSDIDKRTRAIQWPIDHDNRSK